MICFHPANTWNNAFFWYNPKATRFLFSLLAHLIHIKKDFSSIPWLKWDAASDNLNNVVWKAKALHWWMTFSLCRRLLWWRKSDTRIACFFFFFALSENVTHSLKIFLSLCNLHFCNAAQSCWKDTRTQEHAGLLQSNLFGIFIPHRSNPLRKMPLQYYWDCPMAVKIWR